MYQLTEGTYYCDGIAYTVYGIQNEQTAIEDVACNKPSIEKLIALCNRMSLSPIHLPDVVQDFLADVGPL